MKILQAGIAHRDIHIGNLLYQNDPIYLIDLEYLEKVSGLLATCY